MLTRQDRNAHNDGHSHCTRSFCDLNDEACPRILAAKYGRCTDNTDLTAALHATLIIEFSACPYCGKS